jgi:hypothetical protein
VSPIGDSESEPYPNLDKVANGESNKDANLHLYGESDKSANLRTSGGELVMVRVSHYTPWTGGTNCSNFRNGECISRMASGERWQDWVGRAAACPSQWPFGTVLVLPDGSQFVCMDRGGAITCDSAGVCWIDLLTPTPPVPFGTLLEVRLLRPEYQ